MATQLSFPFDHKQSARKRLEEIEKICMDMRSILDERKRSRIDASTAFELLDLKLYLIMREVGFIKAENEA